MVKLYWQNINKKNHILKFEKLSRISIYNFIQLCKKNRCILQNHFTIDFPILTLSRMIFRLMPSSTHRKKVNK